MKITLVNNSDAGGGAPMACVRLLKALRQAGVDAQLLVQQKSHQHDDTIKQVNNGFWGGLRARYNFLIERILFILFNAANKSVRFAFSTASAGTDISSHPAVNRAEILHLHWTNRGFLSIINLRQLFNVGKPVIWTLHDMWAFTGGCHYAGSCNHFMQNCGHCWMLRYPDSKDISNKGWHRKQHLFTDTQQVVFVTCSHWLADVARKSSLLQGYRIETIPNPIDTSLFSPKDKIKERRKRGIGTDKKIILFGAANIMDRRKGIIYLMEALTLLKEQTLADDTIEVVIFGKNKTFDVSILPFKVHEMGIITTETGLAEIYSLADVYVSPAIEDNLPNTIMEALACGTPVVAFNTGGIPDMVDHLHNGYLARFQSAEDFASGINFLLNTADDALQKHARAKVLNNFTNEIVAAQYTALYQSVLANAIV